LGTIPKGLGFKWVPSTFDVSESVLCFEELLDEVAMRVRAVCVNSARTVLEGARGVILSSTDDVREKTGKVHLLIKNV